MPPLASLCQHLPSLLSGCALALTAALVTTPARADAGLYMLGFGMPDTTDFDPVAVSRSNTFDPATSFFAGQNFGSANLATGALKVSASTEAIYPRYFDTCIACPQVVALVSDVLTFTGPGSTVLVSMPVHLDGSFAMSGSTGLGFLGVGMSLTLGGESAQISLDRMFVPLGNHFYPPDDYLHGIVYGKPGSYITTGLNTADGTANLSGTFQTNTAYSFAFDLSLVYLMLEPGVVAAADFSHTAQLGLSLPAGYNVTSASGVFLASAPVPEPATLPMLATGLAALGMALRRRQQMR